MGSEGCGNCVEISQPGGSELYGTERGKTGGETATPVRPPAPFLALRVIKAGLGVSFDAYVALGTISSAASSNTNRSSWLFTARYNVRKLVYFELYGDTRGAIAGEKQIKEWLRGRKVALIES
jgi:hypothetical protein